MGFRHFCCQMTFWYAFWKQAGYLFKMRPWVNCWCTNKLALTVMYCNQYRLCAENNANGLTRMSVKLCDRKGVTVFPRRGVTPSSKGFAHTFKERSTRPILRTSAVMNMWGHARNTGGPTRMEIRFGRRIRPLVKSYPALNVNRWASPEIDRSLTRSAKMCPGKSWWRFEFR